MPKAKARAKSRGFDPYTVFRKEVLAKEGVILELKIAPVDTPNFIWGTVTIPPEDVKKGKRFFVSQCRHEVGHRVVPYAPSTVERNIASSKIAEEEGVQDVHGFLNVVYDLMVDERNTRKYKDYKSYMRYYVKYYLSSDDPRLKLLGEVGKLILGGKTKDKLAKKVYRILFLDGRHFYKRLRILARLLKHLFTQENKKRFGGFGEGGGTLKGKSKKPTLSNVKGVPMPLPAISGADLSKLARELMEAEVDESKVEELSTELLLTYRRLKLLDKYVEVVERLGRREEKLDEPNIWRVGEDLTKLSILETVQRHGVILPGVTTIKMEGGSRAGNSGSGSILLIVDSSGSTENYNIIETIRQASFCIAETAKRNGDELGLIVFDERIIHAVKPTRTDYEAVIRRILTLTPLLGTYLTQPLNLALEWLKIKDYKVTTFLITDGGIDDLERVIPTLKRIDEKGKLVVFLIVPKENKKFSRIPIFVNAGFTVYLIEAGKEFSEEAMLELRRD